MTICVRLGKISLDYPIEGGAAKLSYEKQASLLLNLF